MARPRKEDSIEPATEDSTSLVGGQLDKYLKDNKTDHYNYEENVEYKVSTGSLNIDMEIGGFGPGVHRLAGPPQSGKSPFSLEVARNFLATIPNSRVLYIKAEGRLSKENVARSGLTFVEDAKDWAVGTAFVLKTNIYEVAIGLMRDLVVNNPTKCRYMFIIDSMDGMNLKADSIKDISEGNKVAGAPLMTKQFLQKLSLALTQRGHMCFFLSQVSSDIKLDPYAKTTPRQVGSSGGNAVQHFSNEVLEFQERYPGDLILEDQTAKPDRTKNRIIGHNFKVQIKKSDKEKKFVTIEVPIKYGQVNGNSIWREREVADQLLLWQLINRSGAWTKVSEQLIKELSENGMEIPEQFQGMEKLYTFLTEHKDVTQHLFNKFKNLIAI